MKIKRNLSGIFFMEKDESGKIQSICFEDLTEAQQDEILNSKSPEVVKGLAKQLANTLNDIGNDLELYSE